MHNQRSTASPPEIESAHDLQIVVDIPLRWIERFERRPPIKEIPDTEVEIEVVCNPGCQSGAIVVCKYGVGSEIAVPRVVKETGEGRCFIPAFFRWLEPSPTKTQREIFTIEFVYNAPKSGNVFGLKKCWFICNVRACIL